MSKSERLLELLAAFRAHGRFTVQELADQHGVSRRTMLRDLQSLSLLGVPLVATPGRGGGYTLAYPHRAISLSLSVEEAIGLVLSYEAFLAYAHSPFTGQNSSAITKLRLAMAPDVARELDALREHVAMVAIARTYEAPLLPALLQAARDGTHLRVAYESRRGSSERVIYPYGLYAGLGFWYCACFDYTRRAHISLRADRILSIEPAEGYEPPPAMTLHAWLQLPRAGEEMVRLRATITARGRKVIDWSAFGAGLVAQPCGGAEIDIEIPITSLEHYARLFMPLAGEAIVEAPRVLVAMLCEAASALLANYRAKVLPGQDGEHPPAARRIP